MILTTAALLTGLAGLSILGAMPQPQVAPEQPPNIIFIVCDDLGQRDLGCYGSTFYETPQIDSLARDG
ncbi:MAG: arylsulfatase, partial [Armatimonadota bacterium]